MTLIVDFHALDTLVQDLTGVENMAQQAIADLEAALAKHLAEWNGQARDLYHQRQGEWQTAFQELGDILKAAKNHVLETNQVYQDTETKNVNMWG